MHYYFGVVILPRDRTGDLVNSGERTPGELVEYAPRVVEAIEGINYTVETVLWAHHRNPFRRRARPLAPASFRHRSLRRV